MNPIILTGIFIILLWIVLFSLYLYSSKQHGQLHKEITDLQHLLEKLENNDR